LISAYGSAKVLAIALDTSATNHEKAYGKSLTIF